MDFNNIAGLKTLYWIFINIYYVLIVALSIYIILEKRNPARTFAWVLSLVFLPGLGLISYILIGRNFRRKKKRLIRQNFNFALSDHIERNQPRLPKPDVVINKQSILQYELLILNCGGSIACQKCKVDLLTDGTRMLASILKAIRLAKHYVFLDYYIIDSGIIGDLLLPLLLEKAEQGLDIRIIVDDIGSWRLHRKYYDELRAGGVKIISFMPVVSILFADRANYRNHRKIAIIDGHTGFTGGMNLSDQYLLAQDHADYWKDIHLMLQGSCVGELLKVFIKDWNFVSPDKMYLKHYLNQNPGVVPGSKSRVQIIASGPSSEWAGIKMAFFGAITLATRRVYIATPYFIPDTSILMALYSAAMRGLDVRLLLPQKSDNWFVHLGNLSFVDELQAAGVQVRLGTGGFNHSKLMIVDDKLSSVGSANMDHRSFEQNFEIMALVYDAAIVRKLSQTYLNDWDTGEIVDVSKRNLKQKIMESFARIFSVIL